MARGPLPSEEVAHLMAQICGSVAEAHDKGIVHRDLKPSNILLTRRGGERDVVKVLDFGIARRWDDAGGVTHAGALLGSPPYMSPEQCRGARVDARSDVYTLGLLTYEMLAGHPPFEAGSDFEWVAKHLESPPLPFDATPARSAPPAMKAAILRALAKSPDGRQVNARQLCEELQLAAPSPRLGGASATQFDEPLMARASLPRTVLEPLDPRSLRTHRRRWIVGTLVAVCIAVASVGMLVWHLVVERDHQRRYHPSPRGAAPSAKAKPAPP